MDLKINVAQRPNVSRIVFVVSQFQQTQWDFDLLGERLAHAGVAALSDTVAFAEASYSDYRLHRLNHVGEILFHATERVAACDQQTHRDRGGNCKLVPIEGNVKDCCSEALDDAT